jgi:hypothetical protein
VNVVRIAVVGLELGSSVVIFRGRTVELVQERPPVRAWPANTPNDESDSSAGQKTHAELLAFWTSIGFKPGDFMTTGMNEKRLRGFAAF